MQKHLDSKTAKYLRKAIIGESNAIEKYQQYAQVAKKEGFHNVAYLFDALIQAEQIHVDNHSRALKDPKFQFTIDKSEPKTTNKNIQNAIDGEIYEAKKMYPEFIKAIKSEKKTKYGKVGKLSMQWAKEVELSHADALKIALNYVEDDKDLDIKEIWVCKACGYLILGKQPTEACPVCKHDRHFIKKIERREN
jgi:rubrerythrin